VGTGEGKEGIMELIKFVLYDPVCLILTVLNILVFYFLKEERKKWRENKRLRNTYYLGIWLLWTRNT
jgi:hypothetical protein